MPKRNRAERSAKGWLGTVWRVETTNQNCAVWRGKERRGLGGIGLECGGRQREMAKVIVWGGLDRTGLGQ
jgi:hypothetical protein